MEIIDAQVHCWESGTARPWDHAFDAGADPANAFTGECALVAMDSVGVDAAVLSIPPSYRSQLPDGTWRYDNSYAEELALRYPGRFASVARYDPGDPELEDLVSQTRSRPGTLGLRCVVIAPDDWHSFAGGGYERLLRACEKYQVPLMLFVSGRPDAAGPVAAAHPDLPLVLDHFGLTQPPFMAADPDPWQRLPQLLDLARYPNISVKFSGAPTLSARQYPFDDLWPALDRVIEAFGVERLMWGSDVTRVKGLHTYAESLFYLRETPRLSESDKERLLGGTLRRVLGWKPPHELS